MKRKDARRLGEARGLLAGLWARARHVLKTDLDAEGEQRDVEVAHARALVATGGALRAGVVKMGQLRAYVEGGAPLSSQARKVLAQLFDGLPAEDPQAIAGILREDLGQEPSVAFAEFSTLPFAAASLGQVHAAKTHAGVEVAVKVQYPGAAEGLRDDLEAPRLLRSLVGADLGGEVDETALSALRERLLAELDYPAEAEWLTRFAQAWATHPAIRIPQIQRALCGKRVLTMERLHGASLAAFGQTANESQRCQAARTIFAFGVGSGLRHGIVNLDPNPGNYLVLANDPSAPLQVGFVDFGCCMELSNEVIFADRQLLLALVHRDGEELRHAAHLVGLVSHAQVFETRTFRTWERLLAEPFLTRDETRLDAARAKELLDVTWQLVHTGRMRLPAAALLLWRQRLGIWGVLGELGATLPWRKHLCELLEDGRHPIPLFERYR